MNKYKVVLAGLGVRGRIHLKGFLENSDRFDVVAICDVNQEVLQKASEKFGIHQTYTDAETMLAEERPDVFCFATLPNVRMSLIQLAVKYKVKGIAFEKPMATSLEEAYKITSLCKNNGIKAIVSHQQKYLSSMQKLKSIVDANEIGVVTKMHASSQAWMSQLGTHFMDYMIWMNGGSKVKWVVGHVHGKDKLTDSHPSPDYMIGKVLFENGLHAHIECGYLSPIRLDHDRFWTDNRLTVYGTHGYAWADTDGRWSAYTRYSNGEMLSGEGPLWESQMYDIQTPYLRDLANWLDNDMDVHPCNIEISYHGYEILEGLTISALDHCRIDFPLDSRLYEDNIERMVKELPESNQISED